ncbi:MAG: kynureninase [Candidatus Heimdallarchaeaceae archaeon]
MVSNYEYSKEYALKLDSEDPLKNYRSCFFISPDTIYLNGNSLGLLSKDAATSLLRVLDEWKNLGVRGWMEAEIPWFYQAEKLGEKIAPLVGAKPEEVVATGTTTVNLHSLVSTFYQPTGERTKILADELNFPTDIYALKSQLKLKGFDPEKNLKLVKSKDGRWLDESSIKRAITKDVALVVLPSVLFRSGQLLDIEGITANAHEKGVLIGWDCSHSVGVIPHEFDKWEVDFAFWCSYKHLNAGPGASAFLYVNEKHFNKEAGLWGWFGYVKEKQFEMNLHFEQAKSAGGWQISSPSILSSAAIEGALDVILQDGIENIREKSLKMTAYFIFLTDNLLSKEPYNFTLGTPRLPNQRGGHIALEHEKAESIHKELMKKNIIHDFRPPNILRFSPSPLYNSFSDIWEAVFSIKKIFNEN